MAAERQIPGGPFLNEVGTAQRQIPGGPFANETVSAANPTSGAVTVRKSRLIATQPTGEYARTSAPLAPALIGLARRGVAQTPKPQSINQLSDEAVGGARLFVGTFDWSSAITNIGTRRVSVSGASGVSHSPWGVASRYGSWAAGSTSHFDLTSTGEPITYFLRAKRTGAGTGYECFADKNYSTQWSLYGNAQGTSILVYPVIAGALGTAITWMWNDRWSTGVVYCKPTSDYELVYLREDLGAPKAGSYTLNRSTAVSASGSGVLFGDRNGVARAFQGEIEHCLVVIGKTYNEEQLFAYARDPYGFLLPPMRKRIYVGA